MYMYLSRVWMTRIRGMRYDVVVRLITAKRVFAGVVSLRLVMLQYKCVWSAETRTHHRISFRSCTAYTSLLSTTHIIVVRTRCRLAAEMTF